MSNASLPESQAGQRCSCGNPVSGGNMRVVKWTTAGGLIASLGVCAACCLLPFVLISVGVAGAWVSALDALAPYKWLFIVLTATLLGYGFYAAYRKPARTRAAGGACESCESNRSVRVMLWIASLLAISGFIFEYIEPLLTHSSS